MIISSKVWNKTNLMRRDEISGTYVQQDLKQNKSQDKLDSENWNIVNSWPGSTGSVHVRKVLSQLRLIFLLDYRIMNVDLNRHMHRVKWERHSWLHFRASEDLTLKKGFVSKVVLDFLIIQGKLSCNKYKIKDTFLQIHFVAYNTYTTGKL